MSGMGTIRINKYTRVTISNSGISVSYTEVSKNEDIYFNYTYSTNMTLHKRGTKY